MGKYLFEISEKKRKREPPLSVADDKFVLLSAGPLLSPLSMHVIVDLADGGFGAHTVFRSLRVSCIGIVLGHDGIHITHAHFLRRLVGKILDAIERRATCRDRGGFVY